MSNKEKEDTVSEKISVEEFRKRVMSFREKMGNVFWSEEQRQKLE